MSYTFIYPANYFNPKEIDFLFKEEYDLVKKSFETCLVDSSNFENLKLPTIENKCIYRGWMLKKEEYKLLEENCHGLLHTSLENYLSSHYLPNWYESITHLTPKSIITTYENATQSFLDSGWKKVFVKDYVKSLKTGKGSIVDNVEDLERLMQEMEKFRGIIEGGIVLREFHDFLPRTEKRFFILNGCLNSPIENVPEKYMDVLEKVQNIHSDKFFYSVDLIEDEKGKVWVVEIGDGQVSDYVGWKVENFVNVFNSLKKKLVFKI